MAAIQTVFRRYELKYLLTPSQKAAVLDAFRDRMALDRWGRTTIRNLYFDTEHNRLIRESIERPVYKEKLRIRSYRPAAPEDPVFVELKKKYKGVVYKRRLVMPAEHALDWLADGHPPAIHTQIEAEIEYFRRFYATLRPAVFLSYERESYAPLPDADLGLLCGESAFRVTFDEKILARSDALSLGAEVGGRPLLEPGMTLMEIKTAGGIPLWMVDVLTREEIHKVSFSKYGTYYRLSRAANDRSEEAAQEELIGG